MAQVNPLTRELLVKLVFYGPGLGGKTTTLQSIHATSPPETRGQLVSLATPVDRTLYFDFLPLRAAQVRGHHVRLQLFTVPGQVYLNATRKLVLAGADGVVFVADSQPGRLDANLESLENLAENLESQGAELAATPLVLQYNKRDLPGVVSLVELDRTLNPDGRASFATVATTGEGVLRVLDQIVGETLDHLEAKGTFGTAGTPSMTPDFPPPDHALSDQLELATEAAWDREPLSGIDGREDDGAEPDAGHPPTMPVGAELSGALMVDVATLEEADDLPTSPSRRPDAEVKALMESARSIPPPSVAPRAPGVSFAAIFGERAGGFAEIEERIALGYFAAAIASLDQELALALDQAAADLSTVGEVGDPSAQRLAAAALIGLDARQLARVRAIARRVGEGGPVAERDALECYALLIELRLRRPR